MTATCLTWPHLRAAVVLSDVPCDMMPQGTDPSWKVLRTTTVELPTTEGFLAFIDGLEALGVEPEDIDITQAVVISDGS